MDEILKIVATIDEYSKKIEEMYNKYVAKINGLVAEAQRVANEAVTKSQMWVTSKMAKINRSIQGCVDGFNKTIQEKIMKPLESWYDNAMKKIKTSIAKANFAKLGQEMPDSVVEAAADAIPHPALSSLISIPELKIPKI